MKTLVEHNEVQQRIAAERWRMVVELSKTMSYAEIGRRLGVSRARVSQMVRQAREYSQSVLIP